MPIRAIVVILVLCCCWGCVDRPTVSLSETEQRALDHITRTPGLTVFSLERQGPQLLFVSTRQGDEKIRYVIDSSDPARPPSEMVARLPRTGLHYSYDRNKPRGSVEATSR